LGPARDKAAARNARLRRARDALPSRVQISWQDENTLKLDIDNGCRRGCSTSAKRGAQGRSRGWSYARWEIRVTRIVSRHWRHEHLARRGQAPRELALDTTNLRAGYLRKNGVPFSEDAFMTEYYNLIVEEDGNQYLVIQTFVEDPRYLNRHFVRTLQFKREPDASKRTPVPCSAS
jgi:hypothetical protein